MKAAVIYWSGTGNTEQMANAIAEGAGAELFSVSDFTGDIADYDRIAFGCSAMGDEVLEESEFEPFCTERKDYRTVWFLWLGRRRMDAELGRTGKGRRCCSGERRRSDCQRNAV